MSNNIWIIVTVISFLIYIGINLLRYKYREFKKEGLSSKIVFWILRIVIISALLAFMFFTFTEYIFFCKTKMFLFFSILFAIIVMEFALQMSLETHEGDFTFFGILIIVIVMVISFGIGEAFKVFSGDIKYIDNKITTVKVITASDRYSISGKIHGAFFGINRQISDDEMKYSYYYISDDGKEAIYDEFKKSQLEGNINIIEEGKDAYIKITTKQYMNQEEKDQKIYDGEVTYAIYAPISAFSGVSFDAE